MSCPHCIDQSCNMGSICHRSIFAEKVDATFAPRAAGLHKTTKKSSHLQKFESEHLFPHAALKLSKMNFKYDDEPTLSISYKVHRGGVSGNGGGVSSTGSSATATAWSAHLGAMATNDFPGALRLAAIDELNAHWMNNELTSEVAFQIIQVVNGHASTLIAITSSSPAAAAAPAAAPQLTRLTPEQAGTINNEILDYFYYLNK